MPDSDYPYPKVRPGFRRAFNEVLAGETEAAAKKAINAVSRLMMEKCTEGDRAFVMNMSRGFDELPLSVVQQRPHSEYEIRTGIGNLMLKDAVVSASQIVGAAVKAGRVPEDTSASCMFVNCVFVQLLQQNLHRPGEASLLGTDGGHHSIQQLRDVGSVCEEHCMLWAQSAIRNNKISAYRDGIQLQPVDLHSGIDVRVGALR